MAKTQALPPTCRNVGQLGWTVGGAMVGLLLEYFGFQANVAQSASSTGGIVLMMSILPALCTLGAAVLMFFYKLNDKFMVQISQELDLRRKQAVN